MPNEQWPPTWSWPTYPNGCWLKAMPGGTRNEREPGQLGSLAQAWCMLCPTSWQKSEFERSTAERPGLSRSASVADASEIAICFSELQPAKPVLETYAVPRTVTV